MEKIAGEEIALLQRMAQDDAEAFDYLFLRHRRAVFGFLLPMSDGETSVAEDLTQETFLRLWRTRHSYKSGGATLRTFLLTIARNLARDRHRQTERDAPTESLPDEDDALSPETLRRLSAGDPERRLLAQEMSATLEAAIAALPKDLREAVLLFHREQLTYDQIAAILGCPLGTIKSRLSAARLRLRAAATIYLEESAR